MGMALHLLLVRLTKTWARPCIRHPLSRRTDCAKPVSGSLDTSLHPPPLSRRPDCPKPVSGYLGMSHAFSNKHKWETPVYLTARRR